MSLFPRANVGPRTSLATAARTMHAASAASRNRCPSCHCGSVTVPHSWKEGGRGYVHGWICTSPKCGMHIEDRRPVGPEPGQGSEE